MQYLNQLKFKRVYMFILILNTINIKIILRSFILNYKIKLHLIYLLKFKNTYIFKQAIQITI